jgi:hypothetical protein
VNFGRDRAADCLIDIVSTHQLREPNSRWLGLKPGALSLQLSPRRTPMSTRTLVWFGVDTDARTPSTRSVVWLSSGWVRQS